MSEERMVTVELKARSGEISDTVVRKISWLPAERTKRALKVGAIGLGLTIAFVFVPIAHFVLVPLGLILTPVAMYFAHKQIQLFPKQNLNCPKCHHSVEWAARTYAQGEIFCDHCRTVITVREML